MEWLNELLGNWETLSAIVGWIVGVIGISYFTIAWQTVKRFRNMHKTYHVNKEGGWTDAEKNEYISKSALFYESFASLWNMIKGLFKK